MIRSARRILSSVRRGPGPLPLLPSICAQPVIVPDPAGCGCDRCHTGRRCPGRRQACATRAATSAWCATRGARTFSLCERSKTDPAFPRYPRLPVIECAGYEPRRPEPNPEDMTRARLAAVVLVLCLAGGGAAIVLADGDDGDERAPAASATGRWTAAAPLAPRAHGGGSCARGPFRLRGRRVRAAQRSQHGGCGALRPPPGPLAPRAIDAGRTEPSRRGRIPRRRLRGRRLHRARGPAWRGVLAVPVRPGAATGGPGCRTRPRAAPRWRSG